MTHTPGPWLARNGFVYKDDTVIADCRYLYPGPDGQVEGNTNLFAAAPDLLAALENMMRSNHPPDPGSSTWNTIRMPDDNSCTQASKAIAKAKGND